MDSTLARIDSGLRAASYSALARRLMMLAAAALLASILVATTFFLIRRLSGEVVRPLSSAGLVLCGMALAAAAAGLRMVCESLICGLSARRRRMVKVAMPAGLVLLVAPVLSLPGSSMWGLIGLWGLAAIGAGFMPAVEMARRGRMFSLRRRPASPTPTVRRDVLQQLTRLREPNGTEVVEGWLRANFLAGTRTMQLYIAFCPPFARTPVVDAEPQEGPPAALKVGPIYPHGARIEVRLDRAVREPASVVLAVSARDQG
jgi:hypothetical protein